jgi:uncharacterized caspase-like protein
MDSYWFLLAEALDSTKDERKKDLIRVLEALFYYKSQSDVNSEKFDQIMREINFAEAEKEITAKYLERLNNFE